MPLADDIEGFRRNVAKAIEELEEVRAASDKLTECGVDEMHRHLIQLKDLCEQVSTEIKQSSDRLIEINARWGSEPLKSYSRQKSQQSSSINFKGVVEFINALDKVSHSQEQNSLKSPRLIDGNSKTLKKNLIAKGIPYSEGYQAHHIIPSAVADKSELVLNAIEKANFDIDCADNGIFLPPNMLGDDLLPAHKGSHPKYSNYAQDVLNHKWQELKKYELQNDNVALISAITDTINHLKEVIRTQGSFLSPNVNDL
jgi:hypothetical protein